MAPFQSFTTIHGSSDGSITEVIYAGRELKGNELLIRITYSGVCGTDLHNLHRDIVFGHEGVGTIQESGDGVKGNWKNNVWDLATSKTAAASVNGASKAHTSTALIILAYMQSTTWTEAPLQLTLWLETLIHRISSQISDAKAVPLFCADQTVFIPIPKYVKPGERVGVVGIGGLGHLAIQFARKWGCEVVAFSSTDKKREEALRLGANHLSVTASQHPDWKLYMVIMNPFGKIFPFTVTTEDLVIPFFPFLLKELSVVGHCSSTPESVAKMLEFAAEHGVKPILEEFPMTKEGVNTAIKKLEEGGMRYRAVLKA